MKYKRLFKKIRLRTRISAGFIAVLLPIALIGLIKVIFVIGAPPVASAIWKFDEGNGTTVNDSSNNSNSGTPTSTTWAGKDVCLSENCIRFSGSSSYVTRADDADFDFGTTDNFTFSVWVRYGAAANGTIILNKSGASGGIYRISIESDGDITCGIDDDTTYGPEDFVTSTAATYDDYKWHHVVCVKSAATSLTLYIDGNSVGTPDTSFTSSGSVDNNGGFALGANLLNLGAGSDFTGTMDEFRMYRLALTAAEVKTEYNLSSGLLAGANKYDALSDGLVGYWPMDEKTSNTCTGGTNDNCDKSGNGFDGSWNNGVASVGGKFGHGTDYDGTDDSLNVADNNAFSINSTNEFTVAAWLNPDVVTGQRNIISKGAASNYEWSLGSNGTQIQGIVWNAAGTAIGQANASNTLTTGWQHVAMTVSLNSNTITIYRNGVRLSEATISGTYTNGTAAVRVGERADAANDYAGLADDVRLYSRALIAGEIQMLYSWSPGPISHWKFDEGTGQTAADSSGNDFNGVLGTSSSVEDGIDPLWESHKVGSSLRFDGSGSYVTVDDDPLLNMGTLGSITIAAWIKRVGNAEFGNSQYVVDKQNSGTNAGYRFAIAGPASCNSGVTNGINACFIMYDGTDEYSIATTTEIKADSQWHHLALSFDRTTVANSRIYIDGVAQPTSTTGTFANVGDVSNTNSLCIGGDSTGASGCGNTTWTFNGNIDDVRIYNYPRTAAEILVDMNASHPLGGDKTLTAYWKFDETYGTTAQDNSSNNLDMTVVASPTRTSSGKINYAVDLESGSSQYSAVADHPALSMTGSVSLSAWINPESVTAATIFPIAGKGDDYLLIQYGDEIRMYVGSASNYVTTDAANLSTSTWYHVIGIYNAGLQTATIYINGRPTAATTTGTIPSSISDTSAAFYVGRYIDGGTDLSFQIAATTEDGIEIANTTFVNNAQDDGVGRFDASGGELDAGVRFNSVNIAQGTTIASAYLQLYANVQSSAGDPALVFSNIYADDVDDAAAWGASSRPSQITQTTATVAWDSPIWYNGWQSTPDLTAVVQEVISRGGWASGNDLRLAIWSDSTANPNVVSWEDYTRSTGNAAILAVTTGSTNRYYDGIIDEVKVYAGALSHEEALVEYNAASSLNFGVGQTGGSELTDGVGSPPIAWLTFNENTGTTTTDITGNSRTGTFNNGARFINGKVSGGMYVDGTDTDQHVSLPNDTFNSLTTGTVQMWVKPSDTGDTEQVIFGGAESFSGGLWEIDFNSSTNAVYLYASLSCDIQGGFSVPNPTGWHHIAITMGTSGNQMYLDGVKQSPTYTTGSASTNCFFDDMNLSGTERYKLGCSPQGGADVCDDSFKYDGSIDELKVYDYVRSSSQIAYDYNKGGPAAWYKMDDCTSTTVNDLSSTADNGSANDGTWSGASGGNTSAGTCTAVDAATAWYNGRNGKYNSSLDFDGTDDIVTVTNSETVDLNSGLSTGFTISTWVYPQSDGETDVGQIFNKGTNTYCRTDSEASSRVDIECRLDLTTDAAFNVSSAIPINQWSHIAFSWTNDADDEVTIWINGIPNTSSAAYSGDAAADANDLVIGGTPNFDGQIDDFRVYAYELSATQIRAALNEGATARFGPTTGTP